MPFKCAKNFFAKYCGTMFFACAHTGCAVALTANRNKIAIYYIHLLKSSKTGEIKFANI